MRFKNIALFIFLIIGGFSACSQEIKSNAVIEKLPIQTEIVKQNEIVFESDIEVIGWLMGGDSKSEKVNNSETKNNTKKQLLNSGVHVNRILYKVLIKRMVSQNTAIS